MKISSWHSLLILTCFVTSSVAFLRCVKEADLPTVVTDDIINIKTTSVTLSGNVTNDGGAKVELRGFCLGTANNPTITNSIRYYCKGGLRGFTTNVPFLEPDTYYHVRAFVLNSAGTAYGNEVHFKTKQLVEPKVLTIVAKPLGFTVAQVQGNIISDDETPIFERGFCWATTENPTTMNKIIKCGTGTGYLERNITDLLPGTLHHVRTYAISIGGITYSADKNFTTQHLPIVTTDSVIVFTQTTSKIGGNVIIDYSSEQVWNCAIGICYGTEATPTVNKSSVSSDSLSNDGVFTCTLENLTSGTRYYARAYGLVSEWLWWIDYDCSRTFIIYGNEVTFTTSQ